MTHDSDGLSAQFESTTDQLRLLYDNWAPGYDDDVESWGYQVPATVATTLREEGLADGNEILDAGCGTGGSGVALKQAGLGPLFGIDLSTKSLERAEARNVYAGLAAVDLTGSLPFDDCRFAAVGSSGVFTYIADIEAALLELMRVTKPGGVVVFSQRTDLWEARQCDQALARLFDAGLCDWASTSPQPYLPGHPEYGETIGVIYTTLRLPSR